MKMWKTLLIIFFFWISNLAFAVTILIDPGHGGEDLGAHRKSSKMFEKELALQISKRIYKRLKKDYSVFLTRSVDRTVTLNERAEMAERVKADLFISVHINSSSKRKAASGFETYYLDNHQDAAIKKVEMIENKNISDEELVINNILTDLVIERTAVSSKKLASEIHKKIPRFLGQRYKMINRGIKPGLFYVLALSKRPAVLLEVGFISNRKESKKLTSRKFQEQYAKGVVSGIKEYFNTASKKKPALF